ncbi:Uncharacterized protein DAT39_021797, partial [Clarias magur]
KGNEEDGGITQAVQDKKKTQQSSAQTNKKKKILRWTVHITEKISSTETGRTKEILSTHPKETHSEG